MSRLVSLRGPLKETLSKYITSTSSAKNSHAVSLLNEMHDEYQVSFLNSFLESNSIKESTGVEGSAFDTYMDIQCQKICAASQSLFMKFMATCAKKQAYLLDGDGCDGDTVSVNPIRVRREEKKVLHLSKKDESSISLYPVYVEKGGSLFLTIDALDLSFFGAGFYVECERDATVSIVVLCSNIVTTHIEYEGFVVGDNGCIDIDVRLATFGKGVANVCGCMTHKAEHTVSKQNVKMLGGDASSSTFTGEIFIDKIAQYSDAYQTAQALLIGSKARAHQEPKLQVLTDDVKASHGATTQSVDSETLHYLMSRGVSKKEAILLLSLGFLSQGLGNGCDEYSEHLRHFIEKSNIQL